MVDLLPIARTFKCSDHQIKLMLLLIKNMYLNFGRDIGVFLENQTNKNSRM